MFFPSKFLNFIIVIVIFNTKLIHILTAGTSFSTRQSNCRFDKKKATCALDQLV